MYIWQANWFLHENHSNNTILLLNIIFKIYRDLYIGPGIGKIRNIYVVVQFYPWFKFYFLLFQTHCHIIVRLHFHPQKTKEHKIWTQDKIEPQHIQCCLTPTIPGKAATFAICLTPGRNPPIPWKWNLKKIEKSWILTILIPE